MKMVVAMIRPHKLDEVKDALAEVGVQGMSVTEIKGYGRTHGQSETYRGSAYSVDFVPKVRLEIGVPDSMLNEVLTALETTGKTGKIGDGKVFILPIDGAMRIRTGERDDAAL